MYGYKTRQRILRKSIKSKMNKQTIKKLKTFLTKSSKKNVFFVHEPDLKKKDYELLKTCVEKNEVSTSGFYEKKLEKKLKDLTNAKYVILTNSGTSALHISCILSNVKPSNEVLIPAFTFVASANAVKYCFGTPHFIDVEKENFTIDTDKLSKYLSQILKRKKNFYINKKTGNIVKAIMPVHPYGHPCDMKSIKKIASKYKLKVIEDAADALGSFIEGKHVGTFGDLGALSFNGNKIITAGAGGAILTNNLIFANKARQLVSTAKVSHPFKLIHDDIGYNYRMPNINAALLISQLSRIKKILNKKRTLFKNYKKLFENFSDLKLVQEPKNCQSNYWLQTLIIKNKSNKILEDIIKNLMQNKIFVRQGWELMSNLKPFKTCPKMDLKSAEEIQSKIINLPSSSFLIR